MVTIENHQQLLADAEQWRLNLKQAKEKINELRNELYLAAAGKTDHEYLKQVEHFHNQFHIQLINIHDLKHAIRTHIIEAEQHPNFGHRIPHHNLELQYNALLKDIEELAADFHNFLQGA